MKCPKCSSTHSRVVDSRHADDANAIRRRRECEKLWYSIYDVRTYRSKSINCRKKMELENNF